MFFHCDSPFLNFPKPKNNQRHNLPTYYTDKFKRQTKNQGEFDLDLLAEFDESFLEDIGFSSEDLDDIFPAEEIGRQNMASVADHALMLKVKEKDLGAIKWFQVHNDPRYKPKRRKVYIEHSNSYKNEIARQAREEWENASQERKRIAEALDKVLDDDDIIEVP